MPQEINVKKNQELFNEPKTKGYALAWSLKMKFSAKNRFFSSKKQNYKTYWILKKIRKLESHFTLIRIVKFYNMACHLLKEIISLSKFCKNFIYLFRSDVHLSSKPAVFNRVPLLATYGATGKPKLATCPFFDT